jgi:hypothetical protein
MNSSGRMMGALSDEASLGTLLEVRMDFGSRNEVRDEDSIGPCQHLVATRYPPVCR